MRDVLPDIQTWLAQKKEIALATVVATWGSAPRKIGAHMAITKEGEISGSVSGGCVENAVVQAALETLETRLPQLLFFGVTDETAIDVGLACGGEIQVFVQPLFQLPLEDIKQAIQKDQTIAFTTIINRQTKQLGITEILPPQNAPSIPQQSKDGTIFTNVIHPANRLIIIGGGQISIALAKLAKVLDYQVVVIDPRRAFSTPNRFPQVDQLLQNWPEESFTELKINSRTAVSVLTHDPKIDDPALITALNSPAGYIGALGSRATHAKRKGRFLDAGIIEDQLDRIHAPIGLDIGAESPEEIALAIMAEIVTTFRNARNKKSV